MVPDYETMRYFEDKFVENVKRYESDRQFIQGVQKRVTSNRRNEQ
jgi:hypothetical protein